MTSSCITPSCSPCSIRSPQVTKHTYAAHLRAVAVTSPANISDSFFGIFSCGDDAIKQSMVVALKNAKSQKMKSDVYFIHGMRILQ